MYKCDGNVDDAYETSMLHSSTSVKMYTTFLLLSPCSRLLSLSRLLRARRLVWFGDLFVSPPSHSPRQTYSALVLYLCALLLLLLRRLLLLLLLLLLQSVVFASKLIRSQCMCSHVCVCVHHHQQQPPSSSPPTTTTAGAARPGEEEIFKSNKNRNTN